MHMAHWVTLVQSLVPFLPPPPEVTKWVGCYLLASFFLPRNYPGALLHPSLPMPDPQLTMFFFLLEFRLPASPVAQACCSLFWSLQIAPLHPFHSLVPPHLLSALGFTTLAFLQAVRPSSRATKGPSPCWSSSDHVFSAACNFRHCLSSHCKVDKLFIAHSEWLKSFSGSSDG